MDLKPIEKLRPFQKFCITIGELPVSYLESMTYLELLYWFINFLQEKVIPTVNNNAEAVTELQNLFVQLQNFVNDYQTSLSKDFSDLKNWTENYLENLDVQQEINNKLDAMVESGEFDQYFNEYMHKLNWFYITPETTQSELQADLDTVGAKVVEFQKGEYNFDDTLHLNSNTTLILNESTLNFSLTHGFFNFYNTDTPTKYAGNGNIKILNGTIKGGDISLCHANNVLLQNINFVDILNDHVLEIASCQNYVVDNCYFEGIAIQPNNRNYVECIQIDDMTRSNFPWFASGNNTPYDSTPNNLVTIKNCTFRQDPTKTDSFHIYTCIGGHTSIETHNNNIIIDNCTFEDWTYAAIRPYNWENCSIKNCKFINKYLYNAEENPTNYLRRDIVSVNVYINELIFENNYIEGTSRTYFSSDVTTANNVIIRNNLFKNQNWYYTIDSDDVKHMSLDTAELYIINIIGLKKNLIVDNNKFIDCQKMILRTGGNDTSNAVITNNYYKGSLFASGFHLYGLSTYNVCGNTFEIESVYNNEYSSGSIQKQFFRFVSNLLNPIIFKNNLVPYIEGITRLDLQVNENSNHQLKDIYDVPLTVGNPNKFSSESETLLYNRKFSDFNTLIIYIGSQDTTNTSIVLKDLLQITKLKPRTYRFKTYVWSEEITGEFTIIDDTHYSFTLSNYRVKSMLGLNM